MLAILFLGIIYVVGFWGTLLYAFQKSLNKSITADIFVALIWPALIAEKAISLFMALGGEKSKGSIS
ncbi:MAG TPA: hypothetical protein VGK36_02795 [Candidatus Angelobacter sp.]|jgi:predicted membrane channel-forming protein YqfA (hemolysin III family)